MWSCATTDIVHAQRSYPTEVQLTFSKWRSALRHTFIYHTGWVGLTFHYTKTENSIEHA